MPLSLPYKKRDVAFGEQSDLSIYTWWGGHAETAAGWSDLVWSLFFFVIFLGLMLLPTWVYARG